MKEKKSRNWIMVLYPDNPVHLMYLEKIEVLEFVSILHDRDDIEGIYSNEEEKGKKKAHYHVLFCFQNPRFKNGVCEFLEICDEDKHFLFPCASVKAYMRYMLHFDYPDKYQYDINDLYGNAELIFKLKKSMNNIGKEEELRIKEMFDFIDDYKGFLSYRVLSNWCIEKGLWSDYRRSISIIREIVKEHNEFYVKE